jgi:hypothetical protein
MHDGVVVGSDKLYLSDKTRTQLMVDVPGLAHSLCGLLALLLVLLALQ